MADAAAAAAAAPAAAAPAAATVRTSTRTRQRPVLLSEEQADAVLSAAEDRDMAEALLLSLHGGWRDEEGAAAAAWADEQEVEGEEVEEEEGEGDKGGGEGAAGTLGWLPLSASPPSPLPPRHPPPPAAPLGLPEDASELDLLQLFLPKQLMEQIAAHTNASAPADWPRTTASELYAFLGVHVCMGIAPLPELHMYWSQLWAQPRITAVFARDRFMELLRYFSIVEPVPAGTSSQDVMARVRSFLAPLNASFRRHWQVGEKLAIDESIAAFLGKADIKQFVPSKPHPEGFKIWSLANDGYLVHFEVYEGKAEEVPALGVTHDIIMRLVRDYQRKGHVLYIDNTFTSPILVDSLNAVGIRCCGSVRRNRKGMPPQASISDAAIKALKRGEMIQRQKGEMTVCVWKDQRVVWLLYNHLAANEMTTVVRYDNANRKLDLPCPAAVHDYFHSARFVDIINQLHYSYPTGRKSRRCWSRLVWWLLDICIVNAFRLWRHVDHKARHLDFREQLMLQLMAQMPEEQRPQRHSALPHAARALAKDHYPVHVAEQRDCVVCSKRSAHRKRTTLICHACQVHMCEGDCWSQHHQHP